MRKLSLYISMLLLLTCAKEDNTSLIEGYQLQISQLNSKITEYSSQVSQLQSSVNSLNSQVNTIPGLENTITSLNEQIGQLEDTIATLTSEVLTIPDLNDEILSLEETIASLNEHIESLEYQINPFSRLSDIHIEAAEKYVKKNTLKKTYDKFQKNDRLKTLIGEHFQVWYDSLHPKGLEDALEVLKWSEISYAKGLEIGMQEPSMASEYLMNIYIESSYDEFDFGFNNCQCAFSEYPPGHDYSLPTSSRLPAAAYPSANFFEYQEWNNIHPFRNIPHETFHMLQNNSTRTAANLVDNQHSFLLESTASWFEYFVTGPQIYSPPWYGTHGYPAQHFVPHYSIWFYDNTLNPDIEWSYGMHRYNMQWWWKYLIENTGFSIENLTEMFWTSEYDFIDANGFKSFVPMEYVKSKIGISAFKEAYIGYVKQIHNYEYLTNDLERQGFVNAFNDNLNNLNRADNRYSIVADTPGTYSPLYLPHAFGFNVIKVDGTDINFDFAFQTYGNQGTESAWDFFIIEENELTFIYLISLAEKFSGNELFSYSFNLTQN